MFQVYTACHACKSASVVTQILTVGLSIDRVFVLVMEPNQARSHPASGIWSSASVSAGLT